MLKPMPQFHAECQECLKVRPLLMPVAWLPGWPFVAWLMLCWRCRTSMHVAKQGWPRHGAPGYLLEHSQHPGDRRLFERWLAADPEQMEQ